MRFFLMDPPGTLSDRVSPDSKGPRVLFSTVCGKRVGILLPCRAVTDLVEENRQL